MLVAIQRVDNMAYVSTDFFLKMARNNFLKFVTFYLEHPV
jgi:hypothetical protein